MASCFRQVCHCGREPSSNNEADSQVTKLNNKITCIFSCLILQRFCFISQLEMFDVNHCIFHYLPGVFLTVIRLTNHAKDIQSHFSDGHFYLISISMWCRKLELSTNIFKICFKVLLIVIPRSAHLPHSSQLF